jgi:CheY-like chemotaxis protein
MSKIEANKFELSPMEFNFEKMLQRVVNVINFRVDEKHQKLSIHIDKAIPTNLIGDDQRLAQVVTNLLSNAIKFTPESGSISLSAQLLEQDDNDCDDCIVQIAVTDTGIGISDEQKTLLFRSFQQAESSTTRNYGGTGLGLSISKSIVEMMNGDIWVDSEVGKGSTFSFKVRLQRGEIIEQRLPSSIAGLSGMHILVVDDDSDILLYLRGLIHEFGLSCDTAESGEEALRLVDRNGTYQIYFLDWKLPDIDGLALTRILKGKSAVPENTIIIMISAAEWNTIEADARKAGVDKFLSKPIFPSDVADAINELLGAKQLQVASEEPDSDLMGLFEGRHILLAEDVEINREIVQALLEPTLLEIDCAENGAEAVRMFSESPGKYDMIFMDLQMPIMDGYEATRCIRCSGIQNADTIPIVALTANAFREDVCRCIEAGMNYHIGKPLDQHEVMNTLRTCLLWNQGENYPKAVS